MMRPSVSQASTGGVDGCLGGGCTLRTLVVLQHRHLADWMTAKVQPASIESHTLRVSLDIVMLVINHLKMHENMFFLLKLHYYY